MRVDIAARWPGAVAASCMAALVVLALLPLGLDPYSVRIVTGALILSMAALALQFLLGMGGLLSLGQAAFLGIGAYTSALLTTKLKLPFELGFLAAGLVSALASLALVPITRLRGTYLGVSTLGFTIIVHRVILNEEWLTNGSLGVMGIPRHAIGPYTFRGEAASYYLCLAAMALTALALYRLGSGRFGRSLRAIMENEDAARASGINLTLYKAQAFVVAAFVTGLAGALYAHQARYLNPNEFTLWKSVEILLMVAVGGVGSIPGAVMGAFFVTLMPEFLRVIEDFRMVGFAALLILLMAFGQNGIAGLVAGFARRAAAAFAAPRRRFVEREAGE